jgi:hypothetical protein
MLLSQTHSNSLLSDRGTKFHTHNKHKPGFTNSNVSKALKKKRFEKEIYFMQELKYLLG